jgi:glycosyltransferase involved in cell wall biosynthesis
MRILHLDSGREMRGGQWQALRLHRGLIQANHDSLLLARKDSPLLEMAKQWHLPVEALRPLRLDHLTRRYELLHAHDAHSHTLAALFSRVPFVVSRRVAFPVRASAISRWKYRKPELFLAVSQFVAQQLKLAGIPDTRIEVVYDGVAVPAQASSGEAVLVPWTLDPEKGMSLAQAAAVRARVPLRISKDLEADLPDARALVYLSSSEGLGSGILLAMAYGTAVIASSIGGIPELINDGVNGILVPNKLEAVAEAFSRLNRQLGAAARQTVLDRFTEQHMLRSTLGAYTRALHA